MFDSAWVSSSRQLVFALGELVLRSAFDWRLASVGRQLLRAALALPEVTLTSMTMP